MIKIPFATPDIDENEINEIVDTLKSGWLTTGPKTCLFEKNFAEFIGATHSLAVNSCTSGLHLALDAIGIKRRDCVIVPVNTFTSTAEVVRYFDADPIFCDIDSRTFNISIKNLISILEKHPFKDKIKAIIPVHVAGQACKMEAILSIANEFNLRVIEDAAHALPTTYNGKMIGTLGDITVFSFYATKTLCTGEGGMVVTNNDEYAKQIKIMRLHGFDQDMWDRYKTIGSKWRYSVIAPGYKYNMTDLAASLGIHQLRKSQSFQLKRKSIAKLYNNAFSKLEHVSIPHITNPNDIHSYHLYIIKVPKRNTFIEELAGRGIGTSVHFIPLHVHPYWKKKYNFKDNDFPNAMKNFDNILSLPIHSKLTEEEVEYIIQSFVDIYEKII